MKKLLALTLILGMASTANAALVLSVDGDTSQDEVLIFEGDTAVIGVYVTEPAYFIAYLDFGYVSEGGFTLSCADLPWWGGVPPIICPYPIDDLLWFDIAFFPEHNFQPPGIFFEVELTCTLAGVDVFVELYDDIGVTLLDTLIIHQVPEPMTIAMLGLGGLLALRRRK
ncbi:MAG: PEP-CTERM sorting domain-containing protein [Planctomycetota bacterium]|jgi:hypothetical protein